MRQQDFEQLIADAGLVLLSNWPPRFLVCLCVEKQFGIRFQTDVLAYEPAEFVALTPEQAKQDVAHCKEQLESAAHTQQGRTADERAPKTAPVQKVVRQQTTINYPAH